LQNLKQVSSSLIFLLCSQQLFSKPFIGIYLFAPQKDKCHSNFEKILNAQVYLSFLSTYPHWEQSVFVISDKFSNVAQPGSLISQRQCIDPLRRVFTAF